MLYDFFMNKIFSVIVLIALLFVVGAGIFMVFNSDENVLYDDDGENENALVVRYPRAAAALVPECERSDYRTGEAEYIIEGIVEEVGLFGEEIRNTISIDDYMKGSSLGKDRIQLITYNGVEDQPVFSEGEKIRLYLLRNSEGNLIFVCGEFGAEKI